MSVIQKGGAAVQAFGAFVSFLTIRVCNAQNKTSPAEENSHNQTTVNRSDLPRILPKTPPNGSCDRSSFGTLLEPRGSEGPDRRWLQI